MTLGQNDIPAFLGLWAEDGRLEYPFQLDGQPKEIVDKPALTQHFQAGTSRKKPRGFLVKRVYPLADPALVLVEFNGKLTNLKTQQDYDSSYVALFRFKDGKPTLFREFFDSRKRQLYEG